MDSNPNIPDTAPTPEKTGFIQRIQSKVINWWEYCSEGVWRDTRTNWKVSVVKTLNIVVSSFLDRNIQSAACALTYQTLLAIVPALAILFAIGRGFGFQTLLKDQLLHSFPAQAYALNTAFNFVDSCLAQASEGVFVGIGLVFLLWTLISLLSSVEDSFNRIWNVKHSRSLWHKATDYLATMIVLPVLMICGSGITIVMSTTLKAVIPDVIQGPFEDLLMDSISLVLSWLFFAGTYILIPNTKVKIVNALLAGICVGTAYQIIQWLFLTGQLYVSKYNAIYGSFPKWKEIADSINVDAHRGVTVVNGQGWYTKHDVKILLVWCRKIESVTICRIIKGFDENAFISQGNVNGVYGKGFYKMKVKTKNIHHHSQNASNNSAPRRVASHDTGDESKEKSSSHKFDDTEA